MPIRFRVNSGVNLAECRKIFKQHEKLDIPAVITLKEQLVGPLPARYGLFWADENNFVLSRWAYTTGRYGSSGYQQKIELTGRIEDTPGNPEFVIQTKKGEGMRILFLILFCFAGFSAMFGFLALMSNPKPDFRVWEFFQILPLFFSLIYVLGFMKNMLLCVRFFKHLVNPKGA